MGMRTSDLISQTKYLGTVRGRPTANDISWDMFPGKIERTSIREASPADLVDHDRRSTLRDFSPDINGLFPYEEPRRTTYARDRLSIQETGAVVGTQPWANSGQNGGDGYDISFHDPDPRGWSTEQNWKEFRRQVQTQMENLDFKDDGDYSVPGSEINPFTLFKKIRSIQNWVKSRLRVFAEEWEARQNGGVGIYPNVSKVYRSESEVGATRTYDDPEVAQHHNVNISNVVNLGSKFNRLNTTTDNLMAVSAYGKLYKDHGFINHESQLRILESDVPWSTMEGKSQYPRNLVKLMASEVYSDNPNISPHTAIEISRILQQKDKTENSAYPGMSREEKENFIRSAQATKEIMSMLGITTGDIKYLESQSAKGGKTAKQELANIYNMTEMVHALPVSEKINLHSELLARSSGGLISSRDLRQIRDMSVVNPKIVDFMAQQIRKSSKHEIPDQSDMVLADPENKLNNYLSNIPLFVQKSKSDNDDFNKLVWESNASAKEVDTTKKTADYRTLSKYVQDLERNQYQAVNAQQLATSRLTQEGSTFPISNFNVHEVLVNTEIDNVFGENLKFDRHIGKMGTKDMRRFMNVEESSFSDNSFSENHHKRKNGKNLKKIGFK